MLWKDGHFYITTAITARQNQQEREEPQKDGCVWGIHTGLDGRAGQVGACGDKETWKGRDVTTRSVCVVVCLLCFPPLGLQNIHRQQHGLGSDTEKLCILYDGSTGQGTKEKRGSVEILYMRTRKERRKEKEGRADSDGDVAEGSMCICDDGKEREEKTDKRKEVDDES